MHRSDKPVRKFLGVHYVEWVIVALLLATVAHVVPSFLTTPYKARDSGVRSVLQRLNEEQEQFYIQNSTFLDSSRNLEAYKSELKLGNLKYRFFTRKQSDRVYSYAVPVQEYEYGQYFIFPWNRFVGQKSFAGAVFIINRQQKTTDSGICRIQSLDDEIVLSKAYGYSTCRAISRRKQHNTTNRKPDSLFNLRPRLAVEIDRRAG